MKISIGILAWNEERSIATTIASLGAQTLLAKAPAAGREIEILVVPNGCTDRTASVAAAALEELRQRYPFLNASVHELVTPGKINAWNTFTHRLSDPASAFLILMDADIELVGDRTLENMVAALEADAHALIATDRPIKHIDLKPSRSLIEKLLSGAGEMTRSAPGQLTGQLYCARAAALRELVMPEGLIVEDGFIKQMICSEGYAKAPDNSRLVRARDAAHIFECYTSPAAVFHHQVRQAVGQTIYSYLRDDLRRPDVPKPVFAELRRRSAANPAWLADLVKSCVARRGWWVMDTASITMRWRRVRNARGLAKIRFAAIALVALCVDLPVFLVANHKLRTGKIKGVWKDTANSEVATTRR